MQSSESSYRAQPAEPAASPMPYPAQPAEPAASVTPYPAQPAEPAASGGPPLEGFVFEQLEQPAHVPPALAAGSAAASGDPEHAELVDVREMARAEGFEEGRLHGLETARVEAEHAVAALGSALGEAQQRLQADAELLEWQAVELSLQLSEKIVGAALEVEPERVLDVIKGALRRLVERDRVTVLVNPDDLELVRDAVEQVTTSLGGIERLEAQGERRVGRGGAVLRTPVGEIDARVETQLARAREVVMRELVAPGIDEPAES